MTSNTNRRNTSVIDRVYMTNSALQVIKAEANRHHQNAQGENETGGVLIGRRLEHTNRVEFLITVATGPGESAYHNPVEFNPDVAYINQQLDLYRAVYPNMDYIGTWHKHPLNYQMFSPGDVQTAHAIFDDSSYKVDEIINPIVWINKNQFTIRYYYMSRQMAMKREPFIEVPESKIYSVPQDHPLVIKEQSQGNGYSTVPAPISEEYRRLTEHGYQTELKQQGQEYYFTITLASYPDIVLHLIAPAGYPTIPPSLLVERQGKELTISDNDVINKWTFNMVSRNAAEHPCMVDIVKVVLKNLPTTLPVPTASITLPARPAYSTERGAYQRESPPRQFHKSGFSPALLVAIGAGTMLVVAFLVMVIVSLDLGTLDNATSSASTTEEISGNSPYSSEASATIDTNTGANLSISGPSSNLEFTDISSFVKLWHKAKVFSPQLE